MKNKIITVLLCLISVPLLSKIRSRRQPTEAQLKRGRAIECAMLRENRDELIQTIKAKEKTLRHLNPFTQTGLKNEIRYLKFRLSWTQASLVGKCARE